MLKNRKLILFLNSIIASLALMSSGFRPFVVQAQAGDGLKREINAHSAKLSFIGPEVGRPVAASQVLGTHLRPQDPGLALAKRFAPEFGIDNPERDLVQIKKNQSDDGRVTVRYQQQYKGIPILGGELMINTNESGDLYSINGEISPDLSLLTRPQIDSEEATQTALQALAMWYQRPAADFVASLPELWIYDESLLKLSTQPAPVALVWRMEVTIKDMNLPIRELMLVDAQRGNISLHLNQIDTAWRWETLANIGPATETTSSDHAPALTDNPTILFAPLVHTYTANNTSSLPGSFLCNQTDPNCTAGDADATAAHKYTIGTYNLYAAQFNRDSIDDHGMTLVSTVHYCDEEDPFFGCPYANAFWSGTQMVYGDAYGFALADDVVAHELTHGVTQYESNLFYYYQSGAINESFSDVFGEYYDQANALGSDAVDVKWLVGEDISGIGAIRSMSDPPAFENPDKMSSPYYYEEEADNGGVHYNSGINNKAVFLMVEGGTFNGKTVSALGWAKVGAIYYEVNANLLTSGSDYSDLYYGLQQACANLIGQRGITASNCVEVKDAIDAVEMNGQPAPNFNTDAPLCSQNQANTVFYDDLESGTSNWTFNNGAYTRWQYDSAYYGTYAHSGLHSLYADILPDALTDATARLIPIVIPTNGYLHFAQAYGFESLGPGYYFDGGVLEYSTNGGGSWTDAGALIDYNGYNSTIYSGLGNPLEGRSAFVGSSHGYISTRLNLASLAGQSVTFRWRMGLDDYGFFGSGFGWWLDDVRVYNCVAAESGRFLGADFNGDGQTDVAVFRPSNSTWYIYGVGAFVYGQAGDIPVPADYNGDGKDEIAVFRPSNSTWYIYGVGAFVYGMVGDIPVVADYNGDGKDDIAVFRPSNSTWYILGVGPSVYGMVGDIPVVADYDGDGKDDIAVFRPSNSTWYIYGVGAFVYGTVGDIPVVADYNGDGKADIAVFRPTNSTWYLYGIGPFVYGTVGDIPVVADYDGDGKDDIAVFRPTNSTWYLYGIGPRVYGTVGDIPV